VAILHFKTENVPRVPNFEKVETKKLGGGFFQIIAHHGFMEEPKINMILTLAHEQGSNFKLEEASYYLGREKLSISTDSVMGRVRSNFFNFLCHEIQWMPHCFLEYRRTRLSRLVYSSNCETRAAVIKFDRVTLARA
jgi:K+ transporter